MILRVVNLGRLAAFLLLGLGFGAAPATAGGCGYGCWAPAPVVVQTYYSSSCSCCGCGTSYYAGYPAYAYPAVAAFPVGPFYGPRAWGPRHRYRGARRGLVARY